MADQRFGLAVWLAGRHVADLRDVGGDRLRLTYTASAQDAQGVLLSASLPVRAAHYPPADVGPYLDGLLPEGEARTRIEQRFGVRRGHVFGLLKAIGRDCAGAIAILPPGERPNQSLAAAEPINEAELSLELSSLDTTPLGVDSNVRLSLAGLQDKLLLVRMANGGWGRPVGGAPSTHILKPQPPRFPDLVVLEALGLRVASELGLEVAGAEILQVDGRPVLAVARFDRQTDPSGQVRRVHQEDFCQALGRPPNVKYQADGGPSFADCAAVLRRVSSEPRLDLVRLLRAAVVTVVIGNADAHARNFSLRYDTGSQRLAPLYDLVPTTLLALRAGESPLSTNLAMTLNGRWEITEVTGADLVAEAVSWRLPASVASVEVEQLLRDAIQAIDAAAAAIAGVPPDATRHMQKRAAELLTSL